MKNIFIALFIFLFHVTQAFASSEKYSDQQILQIRQIQQQMRDYLHENNISQARSILEKASANFHSVEIELGLIQTLMQAGEYRHALSAAAHTQAEHPDMIDSTIFYAWLLAIGGQTDAAKKLLDETFALHPEFDQLNVFSKNLSSHRIDCNDIKSSENIQLGPFTPVKSVLNGNPAHYLASGIVIGKDKIITLSSVLQDSKNIKIRNGLGREATAHIEKKLLDNGLIILVLDHPLKDIVPAVVVDKTPFPGSPVYIAGIPVGADARWPQLVIDILGMPESTSAGYFIHQQSATAGYGVYDQYGNIVGIVSDQEKKTMIPVTKNLINDVAKTDKNLQPSKMMMDQLYEKNMSVSVQVFGD